MENTIIAGKYRLGRALGKGAMGSVWLAEHLTLHNDVAIKLINMEAAKNVHARTRFDREAQIAAKIRSAHVVKVLDHGVTEDDLPYIAMECLSGESLRERLRARKRLSLTETAKVVSHVCRALSRAHEVGLVHRDLKPENIFMAREDDGEIVKILDFGVAKVTDALATAGMDPTRTGMLLGTPYYMSPEQAQGLKSVDYRSDLWAVGVVAFECLAGKRPFSAPALGPLIAMILTASPPLLSKAAPDADIPVELDAWLQKTLTRDPAARFANAKELSEAFMVAAGIADTMDGGFAAGPPRAAMASAPLGADSDSDDAATLMMPENIAPMGTVVMAEGAGAMPIGTVAMPENAALTPQGDTPLTADTVVLDRAPPAPVIARPNLMPDFMKAAPAPQEPRTKLVMTTVLLWIAVVVAVGVLIAMLLR